MISPETKMEQQALPFHGGPRPCSGRPPGNRVSHDRRPRFRRPTPVHVTLRVKRHVCSLRGARAWRRVRRAFERARGRFGARLIEYSVLGNHLHLVIEADDSDALGRAMQGLCIRLAKALNALMSRSGAVFDDHYFARLLRSPTELARAIAYVLGNHQHHFGTSSLAFTSAALSPAERLELLGVPVSWLVRHAQDSFALREAPQ
jgi:REP-associated tyrosine transposase